MLSASADPGLRYSRELLLTSEGCEVKTSLSKAHAQELIQSHWFDVLVFGNSLSAESCRELEKSFRLRNPQGKIVEILLANWDVPMNNPDAVAGSPEELLFFIRELVGEERTAEGVWMNLHPDGSVEMIRAALLAEGNSEERSGTRSALTRFTRKLDMNKIVRPCALFAFSLALGAYGRAGANAPRKIRDW